jgi:hypothetical protein
MPYLAIADASKEAPAFREALRILSTPRSAPKFPENPLGLSAETRAKIAAWNRGER